MGERGSGCRRGFRASGSRRLSMLSGRKDPLLRRGLGRRRGLRGRLEGLRRRMWMFCPELIGELARVANRETEKSSAASCLQ